MEPNELHPIAKPHNNHFYIAPGCGDLPVTRYNGTICSVWRLDSIWQRLVFLFTGGITLRVVGGGQPPVSLVAGDIFKDADHEDLTTQEVAEAIRKRMSEPHAGGPL